MNSPRCWPLEVQDVLVLACSIQEKYLYLRKMSHDRCQTDISPESSTQARTREK